MRRKKIRKKGNAGLLFPVVAAGTAAALLKWEKEKKRLEEEGRRKRSLLKARAANLKRYKDQSVYFTERNLESLAAAFYLIKDGDFPGDKITIYGNERLWDARETDRGDYCELIEFLDQVQRDSFWGMFSMISSLEEKGESVTQRIQESFQDKLHNWCEKPQASPVWGLSKRDRGKLFKLIFAGENVLRGQTIEEWFGVKSHFFVTEFWYLCQVIFRFQKWSSLLAFQQWFKNDILKEDGIFAGEYLHNIPADFNSSFIKPLEMYLQSQGVVFESQSKVTDIDFLPGERIQAKVLHILKNGKEEFTVLKDQDFCIMTSGQIVQWEGTGDWNRKISVVQNKDAFCELWMKICSKKKGLGNPMVFFQREEETALLSFSFVCQKDLFLEAVRGKTGRSLKNGNVVTLEKSEWFISFREVKYSKSDKENQIVLLGYGLYPNKKGNYIKKTMTDCTGREVFTELLYHLHISAKEKDLAEAVTEAKLCKIPYANASYMPLRSGSSPEIIPKGAVNFAVLAPYVLEEKGGVYTKAQAIENAQAAVYDLLGIHRERMQPGAGKKIKGVIKSLIRIKHL